MRQLDTINIHILKRNDKKRNLVLLADENLRADDASLLCWARKQFTNVLICSDIEEETDRRKGKGRRCCLEGGIHSLPCRTTDLALG